ncbi:MAG TPA: hypothetical protein VF747_01035 [Blastocatellia bacterium]|jgi:hypothetical protein
MPFLLDYTDENGTNYPASYWVIRYYTANDPAQSGQVHFFGYADVEAFDRGNDEIGRQSYTITDVSIYDLYFGKAHVPTTEAFLTLLERIGLNVPTPGASFFNSGSQLSSVRPLSLEIGAENPSRVVVVFTAEVDFQPTGNFLSGITIKVNGVAATISTATQTGLPTTLQYNLSAPVEIDDVVTWEYDASAGFLEDAAGLTLQTFTPLDVTNNLGRHLWFNTKDNSAHVLTIGL